MASSDEDPPFDGGAQPVKERAPEVPTAGRTAGQTIVVIVSVLVLLVGALYVFSLAGR
jgi:hypothetical protein